MFKLLQPVSRGLLIVLVLAIVLRAALLMAAWRNDRAALSNDSAVYMINAQNLAKDGTFSNGGLPELLRTPGYPLFLVICGITGPFGYGLVQVVQLLLDVMLVYLTYVLGTRLAGPAAGLWAAALHAVSVLAMVGSVRILTDSVFSFLFMVAILLVVKHLREGSRWPLLLAAGVIAVGTYIRPVGLLFVPVVLLVLVFRPRRVMNAVSFAALFVALIAPWCVRNYVVAGYPGFTSMNDFNMLYLEAAGVRSRIDHISLDESRRELAGEYRRELAARNIDALSAKAIQLQGEIAHRIIWAHPLTAISLHVLDSAATILPDSFELLQMLGITNGGKGTLDLLQTKGVLAAAKYYFSSNWLAALLIIPELIVLVIQYFSCLGWGLWKVKTRGLDWDPAAWLILLSIVLFMLSAGPAALPRYRMPVDALVSVGAGAGLATLFSRRSKDLQKINPVEVQTSRS